MTSLPDFHSFHPAVADGKSDTSDVEMTQSQPPQVVAQGPSKASEAGDGSLGVPVAQTGRVETTVDGIRDQVDDGPLATFTAQVPQAPESLITTPLGPGDNVEAISSELASLRTKVNSMPFNPEDHLEILQQISNLERLQSALLHSDSSSSLTHQETSSALAHLRTIASTKPFNTQNPANVTLLQQISFLEQQLADFESGSTSNTILPVVSIDITESIIFVTVGIASLFLKSAMLPATLAVGVIMVVYPRASDLSLLTATLFSVLAILAAAQFYLVSPLPRQAVILKTLSLLWTVTTEQELIFVCSFYQRTASLKRVKPRSTARHVLTSQSWMLPHTSSFWARVATPRR